MYLVDRCVVADGADRSCWTFLNRARRRRRRRRGSESYQPINRLGFKYSDGHSRSLSKPSLQAESFSPSQLARGKLSRSGRPLLLSCVTTAYIRLTPHPCRLPRGCHLHRESSHLHDKFESEGCLGQSMFLLLSASAASKESYVI